MQADYFHRLQGVLSTDRLAPYLQGGMDDVDVLAAYVWNIRLCESLYPTLHLLEVGLRNRLHAALTYICGQPDWYDAQPALLQSKEDQAVSDAKAYLRSQRKPDDPGRVVAELGFGFWISLLNARYYRLWPRIAERTLPHMPRRDRTQRNALAQLGPVRDLRNRVFHHERIIHRPLLVLHAGALKATGWLNPQLLHVARAVDRFPDVFAAGWPSCRQGLMAFSYPPDFSI